MELKSKARIFFPKNSHPAYTLKVLTCVISNILFYFAYEMPIKYFQKARPSRGTGQENLFYTPDFTKSQGFCRVRGGSKWPRNAKNGFLVILTEKK